MNKLHQKVFKNAVLCCCLFTMAGYGQIQSKSYKETLNLPQTSLWITGTFPKFICRRITSTLPREV